MAALKKSGGAEADARRISGAAGEWVIKVDRGLTADEQDALSQWLAADPLHRRCYNERLKDWQEFDILADWRPEQSGQPNPDLLAFKPVRRRRSWVPVVWAAAAVLVGLIVVGWPKFASFTAKPALGPTDSSLSAEYESRVLDDGSVVEINRGSNLRVDFTPGERRVILLAGEAHFKVAKNPGRPFLVEARGVGVRAVGTAFDVRLNLETVDVLVTEGKVKVTPPRVAAAAVSAGQLTVVALTGNQPLTVVPVSLQEIDRRLEWQPRLLDFNSAPLAEVAAEFNRHNHIKLVLADPALTDLPVVASIRSDNLDGFVRMLEISAGVRAARTGDSIVLNRAPRPVGR